MPCVSTSYDPDIDPLIKVNVSNKNLEKMIVNQKMYVGPFKTYTGLIDTGAFCTGISKKIVKELSLKKRSQIPISTPSGQKICDTFLIFISFEIMPNRLFPVTVIECNIVHDLLIGRDLIKKGYFSIGFDNKFIFCI